MPVTDPRDGKPGLSLETAASVILRDLIANHLSRFAHVIKRNEHTAAAVTAAYVDGLAAAMALSAQGGHGSAIEIQQNTVAQLQDAFTRDLLYAKRVI